MTFFFFFNNFINQKLLLKMILLCSSHWLSGPICSSNRKETDWPVVWPWAPGLSGTGCPRLVDVKRGGAIHRQRDGDSEGIPYPYHLSLALRLPYDLANCFVEASFTEQRVKGRAAILCIQIETVMSICGYLFGEQGLSTCSLLYSQSLAQ